MTKDELTDAVEARLNTIQEVHEKPIDYLNSVVDDLGSAVGQLGRDGGSAWVAGFVAGQIVAERALDVVVPDTVPDDFGGENPEQKGDSNDG